MFRFLRLAFLAPIVMALATPALADPGLGAFDSGQWSFALGNDTYEVQYYTFTTAIDSVAFTVKEKSELSFDPDTGGAGGTARITVYKAQDPRTPTTLSSIPLVIPFNGTDTADLTPGVYWIQVDTASTGNEAPVVSLTLRK